MGFIFPSRQLSCFVPHNECLYSPRLKFSAPWRFFVQDDLFGTFENEKSVTFVFGIAIKGGRSRNKKKQTPHGDRGDKSNWKGRLRLRRLGSMGLVRLIFLWAALTVT